MALSLSEVIDSMDSGPALQMAYTALEGAYKTGMLSRGISSRQVRRLFDVAKRDGDWTPENVTEVCGATDRADTIRAIMLDTVTKLSQSGAPQPGISTGQSMAPAPTVAPRHAEPQSPAHETSRGLAPTAYSFVDDELGNEGDELYPSTVRTRQNAEGGCTIEVKWHPADGGPWVYRLLTSGADDETPDPLTFDEDWGATEETVVTLPFTPFAAAQQIAVWRYPRGESTTITATPTLHALTYVVAPLTQARVHAPQVTDNQLNLKWDALAGDVQVVGYKLDNVKVFSQIRHKGLGGLKDRGYHPVGQVSGNTFECRNLERGKTHYFAFVCRSEVYSEDGTERIPLDSDPYLLKVDIRQQLHHVKIDVKSLLDDSGQYFRITYPKVPGEVDIYCLNTSPREELGHYQRSGEILTKELLGQLDLHDEQILNNPVHESDGQCIIDRVPWAPDVMSVNLIPVAHSGNEYRIGTGQQILRVGEIDYLEVMDRVSVKQIMLHWPSNADAVEVFAHEGDYPPAADGVPTHVISKTDYENYGCIPTAAFASDLPHVLYVRGTAMYNGERIYGPFAKASTSPFWTIEYAFVREKSAKLLSTKRRDVWSIRVRNAGGTVLPEGMPPVATVYTATGAPIAPLTELSISAHPMYATIEAAEAGNAEQQLQPVSLDKMPPGTSAVIGYIPTPPKWPYIPASVRLSFPPQTPIEVQRRLALRRVSATNF